MLTRIFALTIGFANAATVTNTDDSGDGSLRQAVADAIPGEVIDFVLPIDGQTIALTSGEIEIDQELTISGNMTLSAGDLSPIFIITAAADLTLEGLTLTDGTAERGGALYNFGSATFSNCTFSENSSDNHGGAIYNEGTLLLEESTLRNNNSLTRGGAIRNTGNLTIKKSTLSENTAGSSGGAIRNDGTLIIDETNFTQNTTTSSGGAIYSEGIVTITNSTLEDNHADGEGGAIFNDVKLTLTDCNLINNDADFAGGGLSNFAECLLTRCRFDRNTTIRFGGGIRNAGILTVSDSSFSLNEVTTDTGTSEGGGAIRNSSDGSLIIKRSLFNNNMSSISGGALYNSSDGTITASNSTFTANSAASGGAVFNSSSGGLIDLNFITLTSNTASVIGGGIFSATSPSNNLSTNSILTGNTAPTDNNVSGDLSEGSENNITTGDPLLSDLADNGGPTHTMLTLPGSPALNNAAPTSKLFDQRGYPRTFNVSPDLGAVEVFETPSDFQADTDNDGLKDGLEFALGTDPFSPSLNSPRTLRIDSKGLSFGFNPASTENTTLHLVRSTDLRDYSDILLSNETTPFITAPQGLLQFTDSDPGTRAFYTLQAIPRE